MTTPTVMDPLPEEEIPGTKERATGDSFERFRRVVPAFTLALMYAITVWIAPGYFESAQIGGLLQLAAILGVVAIGQTLVILIGGIDLSVGAVVTFSNLMAATIIAGSDTRVPQAIIACLAAGAVVGAFNGLVIRYLNVPDLVATLASMTIVTGLGLLYTRGSPRGTSSPGLNAVMTDRFLGVITTGVLIWLGLAAITIFVLHRTVAGRYVYAVGLNREASRYAAVPVGRTVVLLYVTSGVMAAIAGVMLTGYTSSSYLGSGTTYQMQSIAAVILGGTSMFGGRGGYGGTIVGVLITILLVSVLRVVGITQAGQLIAYGVVILTMLALFTRRGASR